MNKSVNFAVIGVGLLATMLALYMMAATNLAAAQARNMTSAAGGKAANATSAAGVNVTLKIAGGGSGDHGGSSKGDGGSSKGDGGSSKRHDGSSSGG